ncbi:hypothetical protein MKJ04_14550 [Pontibacter sp. E15-1]|uniref:choice-of-anchor X domain-containing protein n=1 Tax=Pontibacter sp. E15-1 TaxID=2919918 RepID=UPI001F4F6940|nr:choice-of-anchor X domain-containing protein [Pontibacter sp. E15-1]MCJ8166064.1 hypothetical protein [Pontibacter sp. E15-1]
MAAITIPNRPFSTEIITGLMLPDGIFETTLGKQRINAHFTNTGTGTIASSEIYLESASHPNIVVTPRTHFVSGMNGNASRVLSWEANFTGVPAGAYYVSFIVKEDSGESRIIKKIFVTQVQFDAATGTVSAVVPEGTFRVKFTDLVQPHGGCCGGSKGRRKTQSENPRTNATVNDPKSSLVEFARSFNRFGDLFSGHDPEFTFCTVGYLPLRLEASLTPSPAFPGQYGDLPFQDPWWKVVLAIIAVLLLIGAAIAEAVDGTGSVGVTAGGTFDETTGDAECCSVGASGGGTSYVAAGLVAAAAAVATAAAASDIRDPFRRGQDNTVPAPGELTLSESVKMLFRYPEPVTLGKPFSAGLDWTYTRVTTGNTYTFDASDTNQNIHVLSKYEISAPEVVRTYKREPFLVEAKFFDQGGQQLKGNALFAQCFLIGPNGQYESFVLQDDGANPDSAASDGVYTGIYFFNQKHKPQGLWTYFVIAQDVNNAQPEMSPEDAAQIIGGMVLTHQLTLTFTNEECALVPDGHVQVF